MSAPVAVKVTELRVIDRHPEDFVDGFDVVKLVGEDLAEWKGDIPSDRPDVDRTARLTLLSELAARTVAMLARTPKARAVRRWLATVWAEIDRTGGYGRSGLTRDEVAAIAREAAGEVLLQRRTEGSGGAILPSEARWIRATLRVIAEKVAGGRKGKLYNHERSTLDQDLRELLGFPWTHPWEQLPAGDYSAASAWLRREQRRADKVAGYRTEAGQGDLFEKTQKPT